MEFKIGNKSIGDNHPTFLIAEMSANHGGSIDTAIEIVRAAKRAGADAIKLQTYTADTITINSNNQEFLIPKDSPWSDYKNLWNLYDSAHTPWEWHENIFHEAQKLGLEVFSSPFDSTAVELLENLDVTAYKIASPEITNIPLIERVSQTGKPIILSSGLSNFNDLDLAVKAIRKNGNNDICILKCTTAYPCPPEEANLLTIPDIKKRLGVLSGISDHTFGASAPVACVVLGGSIIEKHLILDSSQETADSFFSMTEDDFKKMTEEVRFIEKALGKVSYEISRSALPSLKNRSSLYVSEKIKKGELMTRKNIRSVRPGLGLHPKYLDQIVGSMATQDLEPGEKLTWELLNQR